MTVLIFEDNLMWSTKLALTIKSLGHQAVVLASVPDEIPPAQAAIVNLGSQAMGPGILNPLLKERGVFVIGHAGHKETPLLEQGRQGGCDLVVSNSTLVFKMGNLLAQAVKQ